MCRKWFKLSELHLTIIFTIIHSLLVTNIMIKIGEQKGKSLGIRSQFSQLLFSKNYQEVKTYISI